MRKRLLLAVAAGLIGWACWAQWNSLERMGERRFQALIRPAKEVLVGVCWPFADNQDGMADGLALAEAELKAEGIPLRLVLRDTGHKGANARRIALDFANTPEMSAVLGYDDKSPVMKASVIYEASRLLCLMLGAPTSDSRGSGSRYVLHTIASRDKITRALARMLVGRGYRNIALIYEEIGYGNAGANEVRVALDPLGAQVVYQWSYPPEMADFRLPVNELKGVNPDLILYYGLDPWAGKFLRCARGVGLKTPILGTFDDSPELRASAGPALEGAMSFSPYSVATPSPQNRAFVAKFRARYHKDPDAWAAQSYDALHLLGNAIRATGSRSSLDLAYAIRFMAPWEGVNGRYQFDSQGELEAKPIYLNVFTQKQSVTAEALPAVGGP